PSWSLSQRQLCDLELIMSGAFSPLTGFMRRSDYESVCSEMRLAKGALWPIPIVLDVTAQFANALQTGDRIALRDIEGVLIAVMKIEDIWRPDKESEAESVFGTTNRDHPGVEQLFMTNEFYLGGKIDAVSPPVHLDFPEIRHTPSELKEVFAARGWRNIIAFQTRNPIHRAHYEMITAAAHDADAKILIHPAVGVTQTGDVDYFARVKSYQAILPRFGSDNAVLSLLPLAMRMAGPREALWHALIRKNYGCTHFIVGRHHASPGKDSSGRDFYEPYAAHALLRAHADEVGIKISACKELAYHKGKGRYMKIDEAPSDEFIPISGSDVRTYLERGEPIPSWYTFPEVQSELFKYYKPRNERGIVVFLTGLPCAGKSTIAKMLQVKLMQQGTRYVSLLDGDVVRKLLSSGLGFSKSDRDLNIRRIGFVASEIANAGGVAICAQIAPYDSARQQVRKMINDRACFFLVHIDTPKQLCEERDRKGLYAKARAGLIQNFTGVDGPYEPPTDADLTIDTVRLTPDKAAEEILNLLLSRGC
ncbi:MAG: bifunctional sulfate adenylyltransferase/adenylylsulfate kinase, partial [Deltaproteobacteria bacterium]|nr:bifunctional sulfate adenylyltransferase/adenylylsulfate kinase [Deltaproteobacteria bacterium]